MLHYVITLHEDAVWPHDPSGVKQRLEKILGWTVLPIAIKAMNV